MKVEDWRELMVTLESFIPYYERANLAVTLFMLFKWRGIAAKSATAGDDILEIGSGPGGFSRLLGARRVVCLDPSHMMLSYSRNVLKDERYDLVVGVGESLPLADGSFDKVFCLFSFRDFMDRSKGADEAFRVLRSGGSLVIVDILKPSSPWRKRIVDVWIRYGTRIALGLTVLDAKRIWSENPYAQFFATYKDFETEETLRGLIERSGFGYVKTMYLGFGAHMLTAVKGDGA